MAEYHLVYWSTRPTHKWSLYSHMLSVRPYVLLCLSVHTSVPKLQYQAEITAGRDCGLAEWITDDSCLVFSYIWKVLEVIFPFQSYTCIYVRVSPLLQKISFRVCALLNFIYLVVYFQQKRENYHKLLM